MSGTPNSFAYAALLSWPVIALYLYSRLPASRATLWTILGAVLLLPVGTEIKFPMIPGIDKYSVASVAALVGCMLSKRRLAPPSRGIGLAEILIAATIVGPFITSLLNNDAIVIGNTYLPGVGAYDAGSAAIAQIITLVPFVLGRRVLNSAENNADILRVLAVAGLCYSLPILFEVRMSPQLHHMVYGYYPSEFIQEVRDGGFRSMVFLGHGLAVSFFMATTTIAAAALWRTRSRIGRFPAWGVAGYLGAILVLCKSLGPLLYAVILAPLVRWASPRMQMRLACLLMVVVLAYPMLRLADLVPTHSILKIASSVSAEREVSLKTRFDNEDRLLARAWERPTFGWGRYGRSRVYGGWMGQDTTRTDGTWIITLGSFGLFGFAAQFGLFAWCVFRAAKALKYTQTAHESVYLAALTLIVAINIFDLLPNSWLINWTWLLLGALLGRAEQVYALARKQASTRNLELSPIQAQRA